MSDKLSIPFNKPYLTGNEVQAIEAVLNTGKIHSGGEFTQKCQDWFIKEMDADAAFLTASCSSGLEMAMLAAGIAPGDEVLVPDFTFVSTAQCVALRLATPVLCDIRADTLNLDENRLEEAITTKTKAVLPVHYAGVSAEMHAINSFAEKYNLLVIEDAAQAIGCTYHNKPVGSLGDISVFSFHSTKNIHCCEGGMVVSNSKKFTNKCAIAWEKGTDRRQFLEGQVEKYQWQTLGSSFQASEVTAALLWEQLQVEKTVNDRRRALWKKYNDSFLPYANQGKINVCQVPENVTHNGHLFYLILPNQEARSHLIHQLKECFIDAVFHYTPLHASIGGKKYCRQGMELDCSSTLPNRLLRLPLYPDLSDSDQGRVIDIVSDFLDRL